MVKRARITDWIRDTASPLHYWTKAAILEAWACYTTRAMGGS